MDLCNLNEGESLRDKKPLLDRMALALWAGPAAKAWSIIEKVFLIIAPVLLTFGVVGSHLASKGVFPPQTSHLLSIMAAVSVYTGDFFIIACIFAGRLWKRYQRQFFEFF